MHPLEIVKARLYIKFRKHSESSHRCATKGLPKAAATHLEIADELKEELKSIDAELGVSNGKETT